MQQILKNLSIGFLIILGINFPVAMLIALLSHFNLFNDTVVKTFLTLVPILSMLIGTVYVGKHSQQKGWLMGLYLGLFNFVLMNILMFLGLDGFISFKQLIFFAMLLVTSVLGGMIGINLKRTEGTN